MAQKRVPSAWHLGIIGGSGLYDPGELEDVQELAVASPFGAPSGPVVLGRLGKPEEYAGLVMMMLETGYFNGASVRLDGAIRMPPK